MVVAVQRPAQKEDPLNKIMKGLSIANSVLGLTEKIGEEKPDPNQLTSKELLSLQAGGKLQRVEPGTEGAVSIKGPGGEDLSFIPKTPELSPLDKLRQQKLEKEISNIDKEYEVKLGNLNVRKQQAQTAEQKLAFERQENELAKEYNAVKGFQENNKTKEYRENYQKAKQVADLISKGDAIGAQVALRNLFRISGDVGAIRAEDLRQLGATPDLATQGAQLWNAWVNGEPISDKARVQIMKTLEVIQDNAFKQVSSKALSDAKREAANIRNLNTDDLLEKMDVEGYIDRDQFAIRKGPVSDQAISGVRQGGGIGISDTAFGAPQPLSGDDAINQLLGE